jgi:hypothetical protein
MLPPAARATEDGTPPTGGVDPKPGEGANPVELAAKDEPEPEPEQIGNAKVLPNVPLDQLLKDPEPYSGQFVSLERVYCIGDTAARRPDGSVHLALGEGEMILKDLRNYDLEVANPSTLEVDDRLAEQLVRIKKLRIADTLPNSPVWDKQPAIVTFKVFDRLPSRTGAVGKIVKFEFFQKVHPQVIGKVKKSAVLRYETKTVTPDGNRTTRGSTAEWSKPEKLGSAHKQVLSQFIAYYNQMKAIQQAESKALVGKHLDNGINNAIQQDAARAAAQAEQADRVLRRRP